MKNQDQRRKFRKHLPNSVDAGNLPDGPTPKIHRAKNEHNRLGPGVEEKDALSSSWSAT